LSSMIQSFFFRIRGVDGADKHFWIARYARIVGCACS